MADNSPDFISMEDIHEHIKDSKGQEINEIDTQSEATNASMYDLHNDALNEDEIIENFRKMLENSAPLRKQKRLIPNFSTEWISNLRKKLAI